MTTEIATISEVEAAPRCFAKPQTLRAWRHRGVGPAYLKVSGKIRYRVSDIETFIEKSRVVPGERKGKRKR
jgi:hypothetical protein